MTKADLVARIAMDAALTKRQAEHVVDAFVSSVQEALTHADHVTLVGFGTFSVMARQSRKGRNPRTGQEIRIPARKIPKFRVGKQLREAVQAGTPEAREEGRAPSHVMVE